MTQGSNSHLFCLLHWQPAPLSMEFSRQEYWSRFPFSIPGIFLTQGKKPTSLMSPSLAGEFFTSITTWEACKNRAGYIKPMNSHGVLDGLLFFGVIDCHWGQIHTQACRNSFLDSVVLIFERLIPYEIHRYVFLEKKNALSDIFQRLCSVTVPFPFSPILNQASFYFYKFSLYIN